MSRPNYLLNSTIVEKIHAKIAKGDLYLQPSF